MSYEKTHNNALLMTYLLGMFMCTITKTISMNIVTYSLPIYEIFIQQLQYLVVFWTQIYSSNCRIIVGENGGVMIEVNVYNINRGNKNRIC